MKQYLWIAIGLAATLLLAITVLAASPLTRLPSDQIDSGGVYIQFDEVSHNIDRDHGFPVAGGHMRWQWKALEPDYDNDYRFEQEVRPFIEQQASRGKKAAIGFTTFDGRTTRVGEPKEPPYGSLGVPEWLWQTYSDVALWNERGVEPYWYTLNFLSEHYQAKYAEFVNAFAHWLATDPALAAKVGWIEMGVGLYGETQPSDYWNVAGYPDYIFYSQGPFAGHPEWGVGWTGDDWLGYVDWCTDTYYNAFRLDNPSLSFMPIFLNCAPDYPSHPGATGGRRTEFTDYAATRGVRDGKNGIGLKNNGLKVDRHPSSLYEPLEKWGSVGATVTVPIAWETYECWLTNETELYWGLLCALDKHPDVLEPDRWLMVDHSYQPRTNYIAIWNWVLPYLAVTPWDTPGVWCALRETEYGNGELGNHSFYLFQRDTYGPDGGTVAEWNVTPAKEGRYTRRTDEGTGNRYMWFRIADQYVKGNGPRDTFTVYVTYRDCGNDKWRLYYDSFSGQKAATPQDSSNDYVQKTDTNTWKKVSFVLTDARFYNTIGDSSDLMIDCNNDGDEYIHLVEIKKESGGPTPTPTNTPIASTIQGSVGLQRYQSRPDPSWSVPLTVTVGTTYTVTTDQWGNFTLSGLTPGTYDIRVKNRHTLRNVKSGVTLVTGPNDIDFGTLKEGDANDDNRVNYLDFSILSRSYNKPLGEPDFNPMADFNEDDIVNYLDFSLLSRSYNQDGDIPAWAPLLVLENTQPATGADAGLLAVANVSISIDPPSKVAAVGDILALDICVDAGTQQVDTVVVAVDFDPVYLQVVDASGNPVTMIEDAGAFDMVLLNNADNAGGQIDFQAGALTGPPQSGTFVLARIRFKALNGTGAGSTALTFVNTTQRPTDATFGGVPCLGGTSRSMVGINAHSIYLPLIVD